MSQATLEVGLQTKCTDLVKNRTKHTKQWQGRAGRAKITDLGYFPPDISPPTFPPGEICK